MASQTATSASPPLVRFYDPQIAAPDSQSRTLNQILQWSDDRLEYSHDYIQWVFPLPERSPIAPSTPVIDRQTFLDFRSRPELADRLRDAFKRICRFYGFELRGPDQRGGFQVERLPEAEFRARSRVWVARSSHNHLRITRIIRSLRVLGLEGEAKAFFEAMEDVYEDTGKIGERSLMFWRRAMERPLHLAPEDEEDDGTRRGFLYDYEKERDSSE